MIPIPCLDISLFLRGTTVLVLSQIKIDLFKPSLTHTKLRNSRGLSIFKISASTVYRGKCYAYLKPNTHLQVYQQVFKMLKISQATSGTIFSELYEIQVWKFFCMGTCLWILH